MKKQVVGIYSITDRKTKKRYIGSSINVFERFITHMSNLKNNKHPNQHLQNVVNKYGIGSLTFRVIEECLEEDLIKKEQQYINSYPWEELYNKTKIAYGGGSDNVEIPLYLLNLKGEVINQYKSGAELARDLKITIAPYSSINTSAILNKKYRIVSVDYYNNNKDTILSWRKYSNKTEYIKELNSIPLFKLTKENQEHDCYTLKEAGLILNMSSEGVRQLMKNKNVKFHIKSGFTIATVRKKD